MQIAYNKSSRKEKIRYIVVHDTGNYGAGADAMAHFNYFNGADRGASADFFADDKGVLQVNDYQKYATWHCGDGKGKKGITNQNSIGIEMCVHKDSDFHKTVLHTLKLVCRLMVSLNIPPQNVVRHFDASGKLCPAAMSKNNWAEWKAFHNALLSPEAFIGLVAGLEPQTMAYLKNYTYGEALLQKLKNAICV
ncbi:MAG: N-acetylmuramoyl-L-alanine amidase [Clostridia bacterium]|nr:N-acetylmuramoyl-L-alanine amidase [Clostridia bacterium]